MAISTGPGSSPVFSIIALMRDGRIVETGPRDAIFTHPEHPYTRKLMAAVPPLYGTAVKTVENLREGPGPAISIEGVSKDFLTRGGWLNRLLQGMPGAQAEAAGCILTDEAVDVGEFAHPRAVVQFQYESAQRVFSCMLPRM